MTLERWMGGPGKPAPASVDPSFPWVIDQTPGPGNTYYVTFALPNLTRVTLTVPETSWLEGEHLAAAGFLSDLFASPDSPLSGSDTQPPP